MAFNLLNTALNASNKFNNFSEFSNLDSSSLSKLEIAKVITKNQGDIIRKNSGLTAGLSSVASKTATKAGLTTTTGASTSTTGEIVVTADRSDLTDNRLRLSALKDQAEKIYGPNDRTSNILAPLYNTGGLMFPYTPSIQVSGDTDWTPHSLTHTNYDIYSYQRTPSATISLSGKFTVQNQREGEYVLACIHFLRTMGKMYYGEQDSADYNPQSADQGAARAGLPPPVLRLRGYGLFMFTNLKCVLKSYSFNFEENMDLITIRSSSGGDVVLPPLLTINVTVLLQQNTTKLRKEFKLDDFRTGALMGQSIGGGWF